MIPILTKYYDRGVFDSACNRYMRQAVGCRTKRQVFDLMLDVNAIQWLAPAIAKGIVTRDDIESDFGSFINGRYVRDADGYTSELFVGFDWVDIDTTLALCIDCDTIHIPDGRMSEIHTTSNSTIVCDGACTVYTYLQDTPPKIAKYGNL